MFFATLLFVGCGVEKHIISNTPEYYYLPELAMMNAKKTKQISTLFVASDESDYETVEELKNSVQANADRSVIECDFKNGACEEYTLDASDNKTGSVPYTYRFDQNEKYIISKVGDNIFREFIFGNGKLASINDYVGVEKTADSVAFAKRSFQYASNGTCISNIVDTIDNTGTPIQYRYNFQYTDTGELSRINTIGFDAEGKEIIVGHIDFTFENGLMTTATYYATVGEEERIVSHHEYTYE